jgi:alkaline phosphatase
VVLEAESSDNFCNYNNAKGCISPNMLLITAADSDAGDLKVIGDMNLPSPLLQKSRNGSS